MINPFAKISPPLLLLAGSMLGPATQAHTPYLAPTSFEPVMGNMASFDASFAERFFTPEAAFNDSRFQITNPNGTNSTPDSITPLKTRVVIEHELKDEGTYRLTTGARKGAVFLIYQIDGEEKRSMDSQEPLPEGAVIKQHFQSITRADTYISHKKTSDGALQVEQEGYQILPQSNPNEIFAGEEFTVKLLFNGEAMLDKKLLAYRADGKESSNPQEFVSGADGEVSLNLDAGKYLLRIRHRADAPKGAKAPTYSYTTTLSILVFENISSLGTE